jgi:hypothetical protein
LESYDSAPRPPPPHHLLSVRWSGDTQEDWERERQPADERRAKGRAWSRIIRPQESLVLYKSFNPLCVFPTWTLVPLTWSFECMHKDVICPALFTRNPLLELQTLSPGALNASIQMLNVQPFFTWNPLLQSLLPGGLLEWKGARGKPSQIAKKKSFRLLRSKDDEQQDDSAKTDWIHDIILRIFTLIESVY